VVYTSLEVARWQHYLLFEVILPAKQDRYTLRIQLQEELTKIIVMQVVFFEDYDRKGNYSHS